MIQKSRLEGVVLLIATLCAFGAMVPDYYMASDDLYATAVMRGVDERGPELPDKLYRVFFQAAGLGHFRPVQDVVYVIAYHVFGVERWIFAVMILYLACHAVSAWLIFAILRRLESPWPLAFVASLLFALHPVIDDNVATVQFGNNIPGLTCVLGACLFWLPLDGASGRRSASRLAAAAVLLYLAIGIGINLMVAGAFVLGLMAVAIAWKRRSFRELLVRGLVLGAALGVAVLHRKLAYGTIGTAMGVYQEIKPNYDPVFFLTEIVDNAFRLAPSPTAVYTVNVLNPAKTTWDDESRPILSWDTVVVAALALGLVAYVVFAGRRRSRTQPVPASGGRLLPGFAFGLVFTLGMLLPYFLFLGRSGLHRYLYPSIPGIAVVVTMTFGGIGRVLGMVVPKRAVAVVGAGALLIVVSVLLKVDFEAARSIAAGHRVTRALATAVATDVAADRRIKRFYVIGYPRVIGRAGYSVSVQGHLRGLVNAKVPGYYFAVDDAGYFDDLMNGKITTPLNPAIALYYVEPDGVTVRRVQSGAESALPPQAAWDEHSTLRWVWNLFDGAQVRARLASPDPRIVDKVIKILADAEDGKRAYLLAEALKGLQTLGSGPGSPAPAYAALFAPALTASLLERSVAWAKQERLDLALTAIESSGTAPVVADAVLDVARRIDAPSGRALAASLAVRVPAGHDAERQALLFLAKDNPRFDVAKAGSAIEVERKARLLARDVRTAEEAERSLLAAQAGWAAIGIQRDDLFFPIAFCRVAHFDDAGLQEALRDWTAHKWWWNVRYLEAYLGSRKRETVSGITALAVASDDSRRATAGAKIDVQVLVENRSDLDIPGSTTPISGRVTWSWKDGGGHQLAPGEQWLSHDGLPAGQARRRPLTVEVPAVAGRFDLVIEFHAFGKTCAVAAPLPFSVVDRQATAETAPVKR